MTGQGGKLRITMAGDGSVTQLSDSLRSLERGDEVPIVSPDRGPEALRRALRRRRQQAAPTLGYLMPPLGAVQAIYPVYTCNPSTETGDQAHRQVPAVARRRAGRDAADR